MNIAERLKQPESGTRMVVRCLGRFRLEDGSGNQLQLRTRKARALLACLAVAARPMTRDALADLLWSDRAEEQAKSSVRQAVFELQHLASADAPLLSASRDELAVRRDIVVTDLELIRSAAGEGDWGRLLTLLERSEPGLLADLDGLDPEFDSWLRGERGQEPSRTLAIAVGAAERCQAEAGPRAALELVSQVLRLDPANEEAARIALTIHHELGDSAALHRQFQMLRDRLREEYAAEPSAETVALFRRLAAGDPAPFPAGAASESEAGPPQESPPDRRRPQPALIGLVLVLVVAIAALAVLVSRDRSLATAAGEPVLLAVLPFEQQPASDSFLAGGLWDDTRAALSQGGAVRVLGRTTTEALVRSGAAPADYRRRVGAAYLLEGMVRRSGERVRVSVALIATGNGKTVWEGSFAGRLGDPLALQQAIARAIEGRLRGRLAHGGGRRAEQIATTPEVYALYSEARALLRQRGMTNARRAEALLRRAVSLDPNYAPAWSSLASALYFRGYGPEQSAARQAEALTHARHALTLAPNLAQAHATLALVEGMNWPPAERVLRRAVELDPGDVEAWNWLGNVRGEQFRRKAAVEAYQRVAEIDPLWWPAAQNVVMTLARLGDEGGAMAHIQRVERAGGDRELVLSLHAEVELVRGDYSVAARPLLDLQRARADRSLTVAQGSLGDVLIHLDYADEAARLWRFPEWVGPVLRSEAVPPDRIGGERVGARDFWLAPLFPAFATRAMINRGQAGEVVSKYRGAFGSREEFLDALSESETLMSTVPNVAFALRQAGDEFEANYLLQAAEKLVEAGLRNAPGDRELLWSLGRIRAAEGRREEALRLIGGAVGRGWRPDGRWYPVDIAQDPPLQGLRDEPRFKALRKRILDHIARERAELGPVKV